MFSSQRRRNSARGPAHQGRAGRRRGRSHHRGPVPALSTTRSPAASPGPPSFWRSGRPGRRRRAWARSQLVHRRLAEGRPLGRVRTSGRPAAPRGLGVASASRGWARPPARSSGVGPATAAARHREAGGLEQRHRRLAVSTRAAGAAPPRARATAASGAAPAVLGHVVQGTTAKGFPRRARAGRSSASRVAASRVAAGARRGPG